MGQFEKIVVLIVFLLVTVIFVVTLNPTEEGGEVYDMQGGEAVAQAEQDGATPGLDELSLVRDRDRNPHRRPENRPGPLSDEGPAGASGKTLQDLMREEQERGEVEPAGEQPDLLLDAGGVASAVPAALPADADLVTLEGLSATFDPEILEYTWRSGDTFVALAERFYGDRDKTQLLRQFNEGVSRKRPGDAVLIPVFDRRSDDVVTTDDAPASTPTDGTSYTVVDGDSLWVISKKVYDKGSRWEEIYEANRDQLSSPDDVSIGMVLRIP